MRYALEPPQSILAANIMTTQNDGPHISRPIRVCVCVRVREYPGHYLDISRTLERSNIRQQ